MSVLITWGTYKGLTGTITTLNGKNVTVLLDDHGYEVELSTDHIKQFKIYY
jgi:ribosomal protein L21E